ncbi:MAG: cellulase family glycosylhydrolase [Planctomycetota bacterium]
MKWIAIMIVLGLASMAHADFWDEPRHGANSFNGAPPDRTYFDAASDAGIEWIRLTWSKWPSAADDATLGSFLQGSADDYDGLIDADLAVLRRVLDDAEAAGVKIVLVPLSLPGALWRQHNDYESDARLWTDLAYHDQAARFWADLALAVRDHPALVGYNIVNEPHPARSVEGDSVDVVAFTEKQRGQAGDVNELYRRVAKAIRAVDAKTPIMLDGPNYAAVGSIAALQPLPDELGPTLYAVHFYEPWAFNHWPTHEGAWSYPGIMDLPWGEGAQRVDATYIDGKFESVDAWMAQHAVPAARMVLAEYGIQRRNTGAAEYLRDVRRAATGRDLHTAFYAFREDVWPMMDYEFGMQFPPTQRHDNELWRAVLGE